MHDIIHEVDFNKDVTVNTFEGNVYIVDKFYATFVCLEHICMQTCRLQKIA